VLDYVGKVVYCDRMAETYREQFLVLDRLSREATSAGFLLEASVEKLHSRPQQSAQSVFSTGERYGAILMALEATEISYKVAYPKSWMKALGIPPRRKEVSYSQGKELLRRKAQSLFPKLVLWTKPRTKGLQLAVCDSLLIAEALRRTKVSSN